MNEPETAPRGIGRYIEAVTDDFSLEEARNVLAALQAITLDGLRAPLSRADVSAVLEAGVEVKDAERALLDFPAVIERVAAYWCWRAGEADIEWWHPRDAGFAGRRRIDRAKGQ
jgi:hypothetical protein